MPMRRNDREYQVSHVVQIRASLHRIHYAFSFTLIFVYFNERYDYMTLRKEESKKRDAFFSIPA